MKVKVGDKIKWVYDDVRPRHVKCDDILKVTLVLGAHIEFELKNGTKDSMGSHCLDNEWCILLPNTINPNFKHYISAEKNIKIGLYFIKGDLVKSKYGTAVYKYISIKDKKVKVEMVINSRGEKCNPNYPKCYDLKLENLVKENKIEKSN